MSADVPCINVDRSEVGDAALNCRSNGVERGRRAVGNGICATGLCSFVGSKVIVFATHYIGKGMVRI